MTFYLPIIDQSRCQANYLVKNTGCLCKWNSLHLLLPDNILKCLDLLNLIFIELNNVGTLNTCKFDITITIKTIVFVTLNKFTPNTLLS